MCESVVSPLELYGCKTWMLNLQRVLEIKCFVNMSICEEKNKYGKELKK